MPNYPYTSSQGALIQAFAQLRKGFPAKVDAGYLQRFKIAPANESYVISVLRFLRLIDDDGNRAEEKTEYFYGGDDAFKVGLENTLKTVYSQLFDEMGREAFEVSRDDLTNWFRASDKTSALVGQRQANTFKTLAAIAGHGDALPVSVKKAAAGPSKVAKKMASKKSAPSASKTEVSLDIGGGEGVGVQHIREAREIGLTVRVEVNLPPGGDADTYDAIFASIKKHLMS